MSSVYRLANDNVSHRLECHGCGWYRIASTIKEAAKANSAARRHAKKHGHRVLGRSETTFLFVPPRNEKVDGDE